MKKSSSDKTLTDAHDDFARGLKRYARVKIADQTLSDDLVQATFMKTWIYLQKRGKIQLMQAFLYHVLNGLIVDEYRRKKPVSLALFGDDSIELGATQSEQLYDIIDAKALAALIDKLPEKYRLIINMRYIREMSLKEMSIENKETENAISVQVHRGLAKLKVLSLAEVKKGQLPDTSDEKTTILLL